MSKKQETIKKEKEAAKILADKLAEAKQKLKDDKRQLAESVTVRFLTPEEVIKYGPAVVNGKKSSSIENVCHLKRQPVIDEEKGEGDTMARPKGSKNKPKDSDATQKKDKYVNELELLDHQEIVKSYVQPNQEEFKLVENTETVIKLPETVLEIAESVTETEKIVIESQIHDDSVDGHAMVELFNPISNEKVGTVIEVELSDVVNEIKDMATDQIKVIDATILSTYKVIDDEISSLQEKIKSRQITIDILSDRIGQEEYNVIKLNLAVSSLKLAKQALINIE